LRGFVDAAATARGFFQGKLPASVGIVDLEPGVIITILQDFSTDYTIIAAEYVGTTIDATAGTRNRVGLAVEN